MGEVAELRVVWSKDRAWHRRWRQWPAALVLMMTCTGCVSHFTVDTNREDPLIYVPGTAPGKDFNLPLEGFRLGCKRRILPTKFGEVELTQSRWAGSSATARAHLSAQTALAIADRANTDAFENLVADLERFQADEPACRLEGGDVGNLLAAETLMRQLPLPYSAVLRNTYNHRVWNKDNTTYGISLDMSAGMRLRLENSVAIPPAGITQEHAHPSAFAAPTFLYFHMLTARELCDPGSLRESGHVCSKDPKKWENTFFLSPSGGLARLGLVQGNENITEAVMSREIAERRNMPKAHVRESSSMLDLLERHLGGGTGASIWWRLWLPAHRDTWLSTGLNGSGSPEALQRPLLLSAESLEQLQKIDFAVSNPCADQTAPQGVTCHSLHYRVMPVPEIAIHVNDQREWVPVGTTVHDLLAERLHAGFASRVPYMATELSSAHDKLPAPASRAALYRAVLEGMHIRRFSWNGAYAVLPERLDDSTQLARFMRLQLLPGDDIKWN